MAYNVGQVEVSVLPNAERFNEILGPQLTAQARDLGRDMGDKIADGIRERLALIGDVNIGVDTAKASAEVDKFLADTIAKCAVAGDAAGNQLGNNVGKSAADASKRTSPLIVAAVAGGLLAGAPVMLAAAGILFGGIAAAAVHSNDLVVGAFNHAGDQITNMLKTAAQVTVPFFVSALNRLGAAAVSLGPQFHAAFAALGGPIDSLTTGLIGLVSNAMPGLVSAVRAAGPVFQGLSLLLSQIGTGLGQFFQIIAQHGSAAGTVFSSLGSIISALLPILGQLVGAGAELGAQILPPIAAALHVVASALSAIAPVLPAVLAGFVGFKVVSLLTGPLGLLSAKLQTIAADASGLGLKLSGSLASGVAGLSKALPVMGVVLGTVGAIFELQSQQIDKWAQALLDGGAAAAGATAAMARQATAADNLHSVFTGSRVSAQGFAVDLLGLGQGLDIVAHQGQTAAAAAKAQYDAMSPLEQKQQDVTKATNDLSFAQKTYGYGSLQAAGAAARLVGAQDAAKDAQLALTNATNAALGPEARHQAALQGIASAASAAKTDTNLLKTALDALSGKTVDTVTAQIQLQNAIDSAATATKGLKGSVVDASGHLNVYTAAGRAAGTALIGIRDQGNQLIATMEQQGATTAQVSAADAKLRSSFIQTAEKMGFTAGQATNLANQILGIPASRNTRITADTAPALNAIDAVLTALARIQNKTVTVTTVTQGYHISGGGGPGGTQVSGGAIGGIVHAYAAGGIEPMQGGIAQIMPPNALRVIGDRVTDDEAYIPINRDLRSQRIWAEAGHRMGMLSSGSSGGGGSTKGSFTGNLYLDSGEFLGKVRGEAESVMVGALDGMTARGDYNP